MITTREALRGLPVLGPPARPAYDCVIIGSGFGGSMAAQVLVGAGCRVLMIERGRWVRRSPANWRSEGAVYRSPHFRFDTPYRVRGERPSYTGAFRCVGGPSVFFGGAVLRFREQDFRPDPEIHRDPGSRWPFGYEVLEPYYTWAETLLDVVGEAGLDPTEPPRSRPYPRRPTELSETSRLIRDAAVRLGLRPFRLPVAIDMGRGRNGPGSCLRCSSCDGFACPVGAKNDLAKAIIPGLLDRGMDLVTEAVAVELLHRGDRITGVRTRLGAGAEVIVRAEHVFLAAGALATPHLLLASGLERRSTAETAVGRFLTRHVNGAVLGLFPEPMPTEEFRKELAVHDFYLGDPSVPYPRGRLGCIQQYHGLARPLCEAMAPPPLRLASRPLSRHVAGLMVIAEDQPRIENGVELDRRWSDRFGLPLLTVDHRYSSRDRAARELLILRAREILREAGGRIFFVRRMPGFSHALGTVRMGDDPGRAPLDRSGRYRGVSNLFVVDGSALPTAGGVNPSLTIAANALRIASAAVGLRSGVAESGAVEPATSVDHPPPSRGDPSTKRRTPAARTAPDTGGNP